MKRYIKSIYLSALFTLSFQNAYPGQMPDPQMMQQMPQGQPSVTDIFGNMSQEDIVQQVQEAQRFFESLSPQEMAEVEKMVEETLKTMTPQDLEDIQNIATMVEPHLDIRKEQPEPEVTTKKDDSSKKTVKKDDDVDTDDIQKLINNLNKQVDEVMQKAESSKELVEEIKNRWPSKITFDNMKRQITGLKESRLAKKLAKKDSKDEKDLVDALQEFHKNLSKKNKTFHVEDTFGLPESKDLERKQLEQLQDMLGMFDNHIDEIMPVMEKFLRKHDPEALEMAKEHEARAKSALDHSKDASVKRGSAPLAQSMPTGPSAQHMSTGQQRQQFPGGFDYPFGPDGMGGIAKDDHRGAAKGLDSSMPSGSAKSGEKKDKDSPISKRDLTPFEEVSNSFDDHVGEFDAKHEKDFVNFLKNELPAYPSSKNAKDMSNWLQNDFKDYEKAVTEQAHKFTQEFETFNASAEDNRKNIAKITNDKEFTKLAEDKNFHKIKDRISNYRSMLDSAKATIAKQFENNTQSDEYKHLHTNLTQKIESLLEVPLTQTDGEIAQIERKIKIQKRRLKKDPKPSTENLAVL